MSGDLHPIVTPDHIQQDGIPSKVTSMVRRLLSLVAPLVAPLGLPLVGPLGLPRVVMAMLGGCSGVMIQAMGENRDFPYLTHGRVTPVVVRGNPFAGGQGGFAARVVAAMQGRDWWGQARFKAARQPRPGTRATGFRAPGNGAMVVMLFNGPGRVTGFQLCATPERFRSTGSGGLRILAVFCVDGIPDRTVEARVSGIKSPLTPAFARLIGQVTLDLSNQEVDTDVGEGDGD